jgi:hypothetical protein
MKKLALISLLFSLCFAAETASAICTAPTGPVFSGPRYWYNYIQAQSCYTRSGNVTNTSVSCFYEPSWSFGSGNSYVQYSFTLGPNDPIVNANHWEIGSWIDFSSMVQTPQDNFEIDIDVTHPNWTVSRYTLLYWNGAYGSISSCSGQRYRTFAANTGDTVMITIRATNSGSGNIVVSVPRLFNIAP